MKGSLLHELLLNKIDKYRKQLEKEENFFTERVKESREALEKSLTPEQIKLVERYTHICALREEDIEMQIQTRILNLSVKIGMQLQKAFDRHDH